MRIPQEYFDNKKEVNNIIGALQEAIPPSIQCHNLIIALSELLYREVVRMFEDKLGISEARFKDRAINILQQSGLMYTEATLTEKVEETTRNDFICQVDDRIFIGNGDEIKEVRKV